LARHGLLEEGVYRTIHLRIEQPSSPLREKPILNLREFHGRGAGFVVVRHVVDPRADGVAPHEPI
jgi:hypothetical protein